MRTIETTVYTLAELREVSESAYNRALESLQNWNAQSWEPDYAIDDFVERMESQYSFRFNQETVKLCGGGTRQEPEISFSGFWSQGDGASFFGSIEHSAIVEWIEKEGKAEKFKPLLDYCKETGEEMAFTVSRGTHSRYSQDKTMEGTLELDTYRETESGISDEEVGKMADELEELLLDTMRNEAQELYSALEKDYEFATSEESAIEGAEANGYEFDREGGMV